MSALDLLDYHDVDEIKSYREPPCGVKLVTDAICIMFNKPAK